MIAAGKLWAHMDLKTLIVDDEPLAREGLRSLLSVDPEVSAIQEARNGREAIAAIREYNPDLVFLDVQMPEMDGFEVMRAIGVESTLVVVFVTAHDQYAIQAFEVARWTICSSRRLKGVS